MFGSHPTKRLRREARQETKFQLNGMSWTTQLQVERRLDVLRQTLKEFEEKVEGQRSLR